MLSIRQYFIFYELKLLLRGFGFPTQVPRGLETKPLQFFILWLYQL